MRAVDRGLDRHLGQLRRRVLLDRLKHAGRKLIGPAAQQQEIDQAVFQRRLAALDRLGGIDRVDPMQAQRQQIAPQIKQRPAQIDHQRQPTSDSAQAPRQHPMVDQCRQNEIAERPGRQRRQSHRNIDRAHLPPGGVQLRVDVLVVGHQLAGRLGRGALGIRLGLVAYVGFCHAALRRFGSPRKPRGTRPAPLSIDAPASPRIPRACSQGRSALHRSLSERCRLGAKSIGSACPSATAPPLASIGGLSMLYLVTGATGLVGNNVVRLLLDRGERVRVLTRATSDPRPLADLNVERALGDVRDVEAVERAVQGADRVIHAAAFVHIGWTHLEMSRAINVAGTANVAASSRRAGARLVHVSSVDAMGLCRRRPAVGRNNPRGGRSAVPLRRHQARSRAGRGGRNRPRLGRRDRQPGLYARPLGLETVERADAVGSRAQSGPGGPLGNQQLLRRPRRGRGNFDRRRSGRHRPALHTRGRAIELFSGLADFCQSRLVPCRRCCRPARWCGGWPGPPATPGPA